MTVSETRIPNFNSAAIRHCMAVLSRPLNLLQEVSSELGFPMRMIGGLPRELMFLHLHGRSLPETSMQDIDIVVEGDARIVGSSLQRRWGGTLKIHDAFQTATWHMPATKGHLSRIDLITARSEMYPRPGSLPETTPGTFAHDVARRDFSVNTLALDLTTCLSLAGGRPGVTLHHHPLALVDLEEGLVRILHDNSFHDDPTRIFRAVKYAQRYGYAIEAHSLFLLQQEVATSGLDNLSPVRIYHEFQRIFPEAEITSVLQGLVELKVMSGIGMAEQDWREILAAVGRASRDSCVQEAVLWILLLFQGDGRVESQRLKLPQRTVKCIDLFRWLLHNRAVLNLDNLRPSQVARTLDGLPRAVLLALVAWRPELLATVEQYYAVWRDKRSILNGHDLIAMGYVPGSELGMALKRLRAACLDGYVTSRKEELDLVRQLLGDPGKSGPL